MHARIRRRLRRSLWSAIAMGLGVTVWCGLLTWYFWGDSVLLPTLYITLGLYNTYEAVRTIHAWRVLERIWKENGLT